ncbi:hypothetical protein [Sphingomonas sp. GC_Shp_3]|uniref:hypothetical protein n=1 Tax=Sphingomonas sp. GC_Shp_3 TaxID=2937383 RepID=UPI00226AFAB0|nr:hypothetical protein [Sphingomonas sp. GC_Shp_3]
MDGSYWAGKQTDGSRPVADMRVPGMMGHMRYLLIALPLLLASTVSPVASLRVDGERSTFSVVVEERASTGYNIRIACVSTCAQPIDFSEPIGDVPMGLFSRNQDDLVFSLWSGGSAYRVRVWQVSDAGVRKVAELSSRGRPDFLTDSTGRSAIRTYEADSGVEPFKPVLRSFIKGRFVVEP